MFSTLSYCYAAAISLDNILFGEVFLVASTVKRLLLLELLVLLHLVPARTLVEAVAEKWLWSHLGGCCCHNNKLHLFIPSLVVLFHFLQLDMNAQERLVAAMELLRQDIELYAQAQREAHLQIKEEMLNLTASAFMAGNPEMVKRALAFEAANETVDKIRGRSGEGSSDRKRKYESGNAPKIQQAAKKVGKAPVGSKEVLFLVASTVKRLLLLELLVLLHLVPARTLVGVVAEKWLWSHLGGCCCYNNKLQLFIPSLVVLHHFLQLGNTDGGDVTSLIFGSFLDRGCCGCVAVVRPVWCKRVVRVGVVQMWTFRVAVVFGGKGVDANLRILQPSVVLRRLFGNASLVGYPRFFVSQARVFVVLGVLSRYLCCTVEVCVVFLDTFTPEFELYIRLRERRQWGSGFPEFVPVSLVARS
ncbi:hypothetical protein Taro_048205 [Colocasia esculenta]|uniref:Uncharacterized protein n=1 Tax=Colocasia esculenta TaxID=4460 RepID=A0A843WV58_COLES|nr:hypothetical protein [Colocasia esculenta]